MAKKVRAELCVDQDELAASVKTFHWGDEALQVDAFGTCPRHFVHLREGRNHYFGLSKFCAYANVRLFDYHARGVHHLRPGGATKKRIERITGRQFVPLANANPDTRKRLLKWLPAGGYNRNHLHLLELRRDGPGFSAGGEDTDASGAGPLVKTGMSPEELQRRLKRQQEIGRAGELAAVAYEVARLKNLGIRNSRSCIRHVALRDVSRGYDIESLSRLGNRYIEVKATTGDVRNGFYLSAKEYRTLKQLGRRAFLYLVELDLALNERAVQEVQNPVRALGKLALTPTEYFVVPPSKVIV